MSDYSSNLESWFLSHRANKCYSRNSSYLIVKICVTKSEQIEKVFDVKDPRRFLFWPCEELNFCLVQQCFLALCFRWVENKKIERVKYIDDICVIFFRSNNHFSPLTFTNVDDHQGPSSSSTGRGAVPLRPQLPSSSHRTSLRTSSALSAASDYDSENEGDDERTIIDP